MKSGKCPKCDSFEIIPGISLLDRGDSNSYNKFSALVYEKPTALLLKQAQLFEIRAWICGACGYTELYIDNQRELLDSYQRSL